MFFSALAEVGEDVTVSGYTVYFWSNENNEPIHVHVTRENQHRMQQKYGLQNQVDVL